MARARQTRVFSACHELAVAPCRYSLALSTTDVALFSCVNFGSNEKRFKQSALEPNGIVQRVELPGLTAGERTATL